VEVAAAAPGEKKNTARAAVADAVTARSAARGRPGTRPRRRAPRARRKDLPERRLHPERGRAPPAPTFPALRCDGAQPFVRIRARLVPRLAAGAARALEPRPLSLLPVDPGLAGTGRSGGLIMSRLYTLAPGLSFVLLATACGWVLGRFVDTGNTADIQALRAGCSAGVHRCPRSRGVRRALSHSVRRCSSTRSCRARRNLVRHVATVPTSPHGDGRTLSEGIQRMDLGTEPRRGAMIRATDGAPRLHAKRELFWDGRVQDAGGVMTMRRDVEISAASGAGFSRGSKCSPLRRAPAGLREEMRGLSGRGIARDLRTATTRRNGTSRAPCRYGWS
jgi:hypothetical protein